MFDEAVVVGVTAFCESAAPVSGDEVKGKLLSGGVEPWLAERLTYFLPLAFGRRVIDGASVDETFLDGETRRRLDRDPVYQAAARRALIADEAEIARIAGYSSEVAAVSQAVQGGAELTKLRLGPIALEDALLPVGSGSGGVPSPASVFAHWMTAYGVPIGDDLRLGEAEFRATLAAHPRPAPELVVAQVNFAVNHPALARPWMVESCVGVAPTWKEAIFQTLAMFERAVAYPMIAALLDRGAAGDNVHVERFSHPAGEFDLLLGAQVDLFATDPVPSAEAVLDELLAALRDVPLSRAVHALRFFTAYQDGRMLTNEVFLDGEPWEAGSKVTAAAPAPLPTGPVGVRVFAFLVPVG
ncbi:hypothetical protein ACWT_5434 [Actinoplanes sp. SE50]|uniref:DUF6348 family protein n=1 Tax=unclassified Actinoplanes TaxID=2626549 RepID=UPI00023EC6AA|nr:MULTISPECIES: DUF6348 family protein [unclassified Actinoplanes]AEV86451.1 hypothetical protein ACPL_5564 [Actinoplanes sp. SE50/110]ATO84849.1 hypothetical protein ACWT_5434 [Actinoplanes sp. SE50]SLM02258.1 hypothetical protein ACSP50_5497 [Actinoplanes sp. SE50/110]